MNTCMVIPEKKSTASTEILRGDASRSSGLLISAQLSSTMGIIDTLTKFNGVFVQQRALPFPRHHKHLPILAAVRPPPHYP